MATRAGYLWKRMAGGNPGGGQPSGPGGVQRVYCVLTGTTLWDYDTEEEAALGLRPRCEVEIIGASPWDGKASRYQSYAFGFLFLSALGTTYHAVAQSKEDLEGWLAALRVGLQAKFGIVGAGASSLPDLDDEEEDGEDEDDEEDGEEDGQPPPSQQPSLRRPLSKRRSARRVLAAGDRAGSSSSCSSASGGKEGGPSGRGAAPAACGGVLGSTVPPTFHPPARRDAEVCGISGQLLGRGNAKTFCLSCGGAFGQDYCCEDVPLPHYRCQQGVRVCRNCFLAQAFLNHLKLLNAALRTHLHELEASAAPVADKGSAKIRVFRQPSKEAFLAWQLYEGNQIDAAEFTELLRADARLRDERENTRLAEFQAGLDRLVGAGDAMALLRLLFDLRDAAEPVQYASILHRLRALAEANLSAVDFILPQLLQVFVLLPADPGRGLAQALQLEALEDFIVQLCALSCHQQQRQQQEEEAAGPGASPAGPALVPARSEQVAIPLRVVWAMMGYYEDTLQLHAPPQLVGKRGRIIRLTLRVEAAVRGRPHELNPEILAIFTIPSPAQLALIQREWALLHDCRGHPLLVPFPPKTAFRRMHGEIGDDPAVVAQQLAEAIARYRRESKAGGASSPLAVAPAEAGDGAGGISFARQMKFVKELTDAAEALRHIDPSLRRETLRATLARLQASPEYKGVCFPLTRDYGPMPRILRICVEEGAVFRSKARVPVLICFEVLRPPIGPAASSAAPTATATPSALPPSPSPPPAPSPAPPSAEQLAHPQQHGPYLSEEEADHLLDSLPGSKAAFHERMSSLEEEATAAAAAGAVRVGLRKGSGPSPVAPTAEAGGMGMGTGATGPLTPTRRRTLSKDGVGGGSGSNLNSPSVDRYASKSEVLKLVLTRRRKQGGGAVATPTSTGSTSSSASSSSAAAAAADGGDIDLQQLIRQYQASCSMAAPADEAEGAGEGGAEAAGPGAGAGRPSSLLGGVSPAVATALAEFKKGNLSEGELRQLVANDLKFRQNLQETSYLDVQFFVSMAFGESWAAKRARIQAASPDGQRPGWDLLSMIVKSNDDLRQEVCTVQLIELCRDVFGEAGLELWLEPYGIMSTTSSTGLIETLTDALSLDALKKKEGYVSLAHHFEASYGHDRARLAHAKRAFITSLAAYSLVCYVLQIKDRHNGNILLDTAGHLIHIDYGFILGIAPGGSFSIETAPFKLTAEMVDVMGGVDSPLFDEFTTLFACGFHALQINIERIVVLIEIMAESSRYPCFHNADKHVIIQRLRQRLCPGRSKADTVAFALDLIMQSYNSITTRQYDNYQYLSQNIMP